MNPQLLRTLAIERMNDVAREAEERRRASGLPARRGLRTRGEGRPGRDRPGLVGSIRPLQPRA